RPHQPGAARRRSSQGLDLCRARLSPAAADAVGRPFAVRHAGPARPVESRARHLGRRRAPQGRDARQRTDLEGRVADRTQPRGQAADALALAREAFALAPERIAATERLAELQIKAGEGRRALKTLERGWAVVPHPDLAQLYLKASGETDPLKRIGVIRRLAAHK